MGADAIEDIFRALGFEILDHGYMIARILYYDKVCIVNNTPKVAPTAIISSFYFKVLYFRV